MKYLGYLPRKENESEEDWLFRVLQKKHELEKLLGRKVLGKTEEDRMHFYEEEV